MITSRQNYEVMSYAEYYAKSMLSGKMPEQYCIWSMEFKVKQKE